MITTNCAMCGEIADCNADEVCDECASMPEYAEEFLDDGDDYYDDYDDEY